MLNETIFECRCCGDAIRGLNDGTFFHDARGPWRRIGNIDGPNAICPVCVADPGCLDSKVEDGYENASILIDSKNAPSPAQKAWDAWARS